MIEEKNEYGRNYRNSMRERGYVRFDKWIPREYKEMMRAVIEVLSCHKESPESAIDFREDIKALCENIQHRFESEYHVKNER